MPCQLLLRALLPVIVLLFEITVIPAYGSKIPELVAVNPPSVVPSAPKSNVIALLLPPASTTGLPLPVSTPLKMSCLFTFTFSL